LFDEPLNAFSNIVFFIVAWTAWRFGNRLHALSPGLRVLIGLSLCVGAGSMTWHTFATPWALYLDVVPILLFQLVFLWLYCRLVVGLSRVSVVFFLLGFLLVGLWLGQYREWLNGVLFYAPILVVFLTIGVYHRLRARHERYIMLVCALFFCVALFCRTIDLIVCRRLPIGTHFLWHILNGFVVYFSMRALIVNFGQHEKGNRLSSLELPPLHPA
jgi:hypothetical protein